MEVINGTSLQFYLLIRKKHDIKPLWMAKKCHRKAATVVPKVSKDLARGRGREARCKRDTN